jgi:hypothetical protein
MLLLRCPPSKADLDVDLPSYWPTLGTSLGLTLLSTKSPLVIPDRDAFFTRGIGDIALRTQTITRANIARATPVHT